MGLDVVVYKNVKFIENVEEYDDENCRLILKNGDVINEDDFEIFDLNEYFPLHSEGLSKYVYTFDTDNGNYYSFHAGSYSGYGEWRNWLAKMAGYEKSESGRYDETAWNSDQTGDFVELINFSDCDGSINKVFCEKLYQDFVRNKDRIEAQLSDDRFSQYYFTTYMNFLQAFDDARENGIVSFC